VEVAIVLKKVIQNVISVVEVGESGGNYDRRPNS
jgi:hypothetical protein